MSRDRRLLSRITYCRGLSSTRPCDSWTGLETRAIMLPCLQLLDASRVARYIRRAGTRCNFLGIEVETVPVPGGPDLRSIFALYCGTASAQTIR